MENKLASPHMLQAYPISQLPAPCNSWPPFQKEARFHGPSRVNSACAVKLNPYVVRALIEYNRGADSDICCMKVMDGQYVSEWKLSNNDTILLRLFKNGKVSGCRINSAGTHSALGTVDGSWNVSSLVLLQLLIGMDENETFSNLMDQMAPFGATGPTTMDPQLAYRICDEYDHLVETDVLRLDLPGNSMKVLKESELQMNVLSGTVICGKPKILDKVAQDAVSGPISYAQAKKMFQDWAARHHWTAEEEKYIYSFPDDYPVPSEVIKIASRYVSSRNFARPMNNFLWRGVTGYGKSTGVELLSGLLHMPLLRLTCNSTMETQDFLSKLIPNTEPEIPTAAPASLPNFNEILFSPCDAYEQMTGKWLDTVSVEECLAMREKICMQQVQRKKDKENHAMQTNAPLYKMVESEYVQALRNGYICEIQELSRIKDQGVTVGLNEYDRAGAYIPLVDGSTVQRHPEAMVIYTDNVGYRTCRPIDPSVLRRMAFVIDSWDQPKELVLSRIIYNTRFENKKLLNRLYSVWDEIRNYCKEKDLQDGSVTSAELECWAKAVMMDNYSEYKLRESCIECVVAKASSDQDEQRQIISSIVETKL